MTLNNGEATRGKTNKETGNDCTSCASNAIYKHRVNFKMNVSAEWKLRNIWVFRGWLKLAILGGLFKWCDLRQQLEQDSWSPKTRCLYAILFLVGVGAGRYGFNDSSQWRNNSFQISDQRFVLFLYKKIQLILYFISPESSLVLVLFYYVIF